MTVVQPAAPPRAPSRFVTAFDPWGSGPPPALLELMPLAFWRERRMLPVASEGATIRVGVVGPLSADAITELRAASFRSVQVASVADDEMDFWSQVSFGERSWEDALTAAFGGLLRSLGLHAAPGARLPDMPTRDTPVEQVATAFELAEDAALEVLSLRARLPQIRLERYTLGRHLAALVPEAEARSLRLVPVIVRRGHAVVATAQVPGPLARSRIGELVGVEHRIVVCSPTALTGALSAVYGVADVARSGAGDDDVFARLVDLGVLDHGRQAALQRVSSIAGEPRLAAATRLGYVGRRQVRQATASVLGMTALEEEVVSAEPRPAALGSPILWRRLRCVPAQRSRRGIVVAADAPLAPHQLELVRRLCGAAEASARYCGPSDLDAMLRELPPGAPQPYGIEDHFQESGLMTPDQAAAARKRAAREGLGLDDAPVGRRTLDREDLVEAHGIVAGRSWIRIDRYAPEADVANALPYAVALAERAVPLRKQGRSLVVAFLDADGDADAVARAAGSAVETVLAVAVDPAAAVERWYAPRVAAPDAYVQLGRFLLSRDLLSRTQVNDALEAIARGRHPDVALTQNGMITPARLAFALSEHLGLQLAGLEPRPRSVTRVDALGHERVDTVWEDPVDGRLARQIPRDAALQRGTLAVRRMRDGSAEVAFANPLDDEAAEEARLYLGAAVTRTVTTRRELEAAQRRVYASRSVGERLIEAGVIVRDQLDRALEVHDRTGVRVGVGLVTLGYVTEAEFAATIAEQAALPFVDLDAAEPDHEIVRLVPHDLARTQGFCPIYDDGEALVVACADLPEAIGLDAVTKITGRAVTPVIVTETALSRALAAVWREEYLHISAAQLAARSPEDSARSVLSRGQRVFFGALLVATLVGLATAPIITVTAFVVFSTLLYVGLSAYKFYLAYRALGTSFEIEVTAEDVAVLDERELPVYTILIPVYREARVFPILVRAIQRLDYPTTKLDVNVLLEEDDRETIEVARKAGLPSYFHLLVVPQGLLKGKPKACNYGLIHAKGEYVVIYDAEDIPEPSQLKKAIVAFAKGPERLGCVQAKLNYFNRSQNLLTKWFTIEYSMWFDLFLPGLDASRSPIPLGGTSNHFRTARLRELGAWDPHNVTEDADLGMRLYKKGWTTAVIDSTTYEEANSELYNWIRQRSRWVKGYIQTYLVHMRHPLRLYRQIGPKAFISFQFVVGGTFFGYLLNPVYWLLTAAWFLFHWGIIRDIFPAPVFYLGAVGLYVGNFAFTYLNVAGCLRRQYYGMVKYALLSPIYWAFMSVAAWKGFLQLFYKPSYWEKTDHGLYRGAIKVDLGRSAASEGS